MSLRTHSKRLAATALILALSTGPSYAFSLKPTLTEIGGGVFLPEDKTFQKFYNDHRAPQDPDKQVTTFRLTTGWFIYRIVSLSLSAGYMYASGFGLQEQTSPLPSDDPSCAPGFKPEAEDQPLPKCDWDYSLRTRDLYSLSAIPIQADLGLRLHVFRNQWIIPYGIAGADEVIARSSHRQLKSERYWFEKRGWHYGGGAMILLDTFDRYHADKMEDEWGIADTYLTLDGRKGTVRDKDARDLNTGAILRQHDFSGWTYTASLTFRLKSN
ncbi:MAG: hypothetical protein HYT87_15840 [Nitrospirae bacterium]|nr:hypothetical protein [Nitrospirota bacterium]